MTVINEGRRFGLSRSWQSASVQIASGAAISGSVLLAGRSLAGFSAPEDWTQASLTFDACACPNGTYYPVFVDTTELVLQISASRYYSGSQLSILNSAYGFRFRSGSTSGDADNQGAARSFAVFIQG